MTPISILPCSGDVLEWLERHRVGSFLPDDDGFPAFTYPQARCELSRSWQVVLLRTDGELRAVAIVRRRRRVGKVDATFEVREWKPFEVQVPSKELARGPRTVKNALNRATGLTPEQERDLIGALARHLPWLPATINDFRSQIGPLNVPAAVAGQLGLERDAFRTVLGASGYPMQFISMHHYQQGQRGFVDGMPENRGPSEDEQILQDWQHLTGWTPTADCYGASRTYARSRTRQKLTVLHVNKAKLETTTGADLIYVNESNNALVLIQYKRMAHQDAKGLWGYRLGDDRLDGQLRRLKAIDDAFATAPIADEDWSARLYPHPSFVKLCDSKIVLGDNTAPTPGMVLPLEQFSRLYDKFKAAGVARFTRENVAHSLNSTLMIDLIKDGWIGTRSRAHAMKVLGNFIDGRLDAGASVTLATKHKIEPPPNARSGPDPDPAPQALPGLELGTM